jgi:hypothetical protein
MMKQRSLGRVPYGLCRVKSRVVDVVAARATAVSRRAVSRRDGRTLCVTNYERYGMLLSPVLAMVAMFVDAAGGRRGRTADLSEHRVALDLPLGVEQVDPHVLLHRGERDELAGDRRDDELRGVAARRGGLGPHVVLDDLRSSTAAP